MFDVFPFCETVSRNLSAVGLLRKRRRRADKKLSGSFRKRDGFVRGQEADTGRCRFRKGETMLGTYRKNKRQRACRDGLDGEVLAAAYLQERGYELLAANYRYAHREIDLVMQKDGLVVFVEVKTRSRSALTDGPSAVDRRKQMFLYSAAAKFMRQWDRNEDVRFDILLVEVFPGGKRVVEHLEGAFSPYGG